MADQASVLAELARRRDQLPPDKQAIVDELSRRQAGGDLSSQSAAQPPRPAIRQFLENVGESSKRFLGGLAGMATHPLQTAKGLGAVGVGAAQAAFPVLTRDLPPERRAEASAAFTSAKDFYRDRYGGLGNVAHTLWTDPVGTAADVSTFASGVGSVARMTGFPRVAQAAKTASAITNPLAPVSKLGSIAGEQLAKATAPSRQNVAEWLSVKSLRPNPRNLPEQNVALARTQLRERIPTTVKGYQTGSAILEGLNNRIMNVIKAIDEQGGKIDVDIVRRELDDVRNAFETIDPTGNQAKINTMDRRIGKSMGTFETRMTQKPSTSGLVDASGQPYMVDVPEKVRVSGKVPILEGHLRKQKTYRVLNESYGEQRAVDVESLKALARGLKKEIEREAAGFKGAVPDAENVAALNKRESDIIKLQKAMLPRISQQSAASPIPSGPLFAGRVVKSATGMPILGLAAGGLREITSVPSLASKTALAIAPGSGPTVFGKAIRNFPRLTPYARIPSVLPPAQ